MDNREQQIAIVCAELCKSGQFETGQGTCALLCMQSLGDPRKSGCGVRATVHRKLAGQIVDALAQDTPSHG